MASLTFAVTHACSFENVSLNSYGMIDLIFLPKVSDLGDPDKVENFTLQEYFYLCILWKVEFFKFLN